MIQQLKMLIQYKQKYQKIYQKNLKYQILQEKKIIKTFFIVLVGNKCDLEDKRQVSYKEGKELAEKNDLLYFETSAKDGIGVDEMFLNSAMEISKKIEQGYYDIMILVE